MFFYEHLCTFTNEDELLRTYTNTYEHSNTKMSVYEHLRTFTRDKEKNDERTSERATDRPNEIHFGQTKTISWHKNLFFWQKNQSLDRPFHFSQTNPFFYRKTIFVQGNFFYKIIHFCQKYLFFIRIFSERSTFAVKSIFGKKSMFWLENPFFGGKPFLNRKIIFSWKTPF